MEAIGTPHQLVRQPLAYMLVRAPAAFVQFFSIFEFDFTSKLTLSNMKSSKLSIFKLEIFKNLIRNVEGS